MCIVYRSIYLEDIGPISLAGISLSDANELINSKINKYFIDSKVIKDNDKVETLKEVFAGLSIQSTNLLTHLMNSGRIDLFDDVAKCFVDLYNEKVGNQNVTLISATKLSDELLMEIKSKVKSLTFKNVHLINKVDRNLIGGFILKVGDKQYDASFKQQLKNLEQEFFNTSIQ